MPYVFKRNDRRPRWRVQLKVNGDPIDLTGAAGVKFTMKTGSTLKVNKQPMTIIDAPTGIVEYAWGATDTDTSGTYNVEVEVQWTGTEFQTFPSTGYFTLTIEDDLA
jgi:hypothetical protein